MREGDRLPRLGLGLGFNRFDRFGWFIITIWSGRPHSVFGKFIIWRYCTDFGMCWQQAAQMLTVWVAGGLGGDGISWVGAWAEGFGFLFEEKSKGLVNLGPNSLC